MIHRTNLILLLFLLLLPLPGRGREGSGGGGSGRFPLGGTTAEEGPAKSSVIKGYNEDRGPSDQ